jgi:transmembrane sensor
VNPSRRVIAPSDALLAEAAARFRRLRDAPDDLGAVADMRAWMQQDLEHAVAADMVAATWRGSEGAAVDAAALPVRRAWVRPALAASLLLLAVAVGAFVASSIPRMEATYETVRGERLDVALADGSRLRLNGNSRIDVVLGLFGRDLRLVQGEAEFVVAKDRLRPFVVDAGKLTVRAVGTDFTVRRDEDSAVAVVLVEGVVAIQSVGTGFAPLTMLAGTKMTLASGAASPLVRKVDPANELAWRDGQILFNRAPLSDALREFARYTGMRIDIAAADLGRLEVSGAFKANDLQSFLDIVARAYPLKWRRVGDATYLIERR